MQNLTRDEITTTLAEATGTGMPADYLGQADALLDASARKVDTAVAAVHDEWQMFPLREQTLAMHAYRTTGHQMAFRDGWDVALLNAAELGLHRLGTPNQDADGQARHDAAVSLITPIIYPEWDRWVASKFEAGTLLPLWHERQVLNRVVDILGALFPDTGEHAAYARGYGNGVEDERTSTEHIGDQGPAVKTRPNRTNPYPEPTATPPEL